VALAKTKFKQVTDIGNITGLNQVGLDVKFKRGTDVDELVKNLHRYTSFMTTDSFNCEVLIHNECKLRSIPELLDEWVKFRVETLRRVYKFRLDKKEKRAHLLNSWENIKDSLDEFITILRQNKKADAKEIVMKKYSLDSEQVDYLFDLGISTITKDMAEKKLKDVYDLRNEIKELSDKTNSDDLIKQDIINELFEVAKEFASQRRTSLEAPLEIPDDDAKPIITDEPVTVYLTKSGCLKRIKDLNGYGKFKLREDDEIIDTFNIKNNEYILVFTSSGDVYKVMANNVDASYGFCKETIAEMLRLEVDNKVVYVDAAGDYSKHINIIYKDGRGFVLMYSRVNGKREKYINCYDKLEEGQYFILEDDVFFTITDTRKAQYIDLRTIVRFCDKRTAIRTIRINEKSGKMLGVYPARLVPDLEAIDLERYSKGYAVSIRDDVIFATSKEEEEPVETEEGAKEDTEEDTEDSLETSEGNGEAEE
jgi:DNA gyrase/topoisomerase IV subunit A